MKLSTTIASQTVGRLASGLGWIIRHKAAIGYFVYLNIGIMAAGWFLMHYGDAMLQHPVYLLLDAVLPFLVPVRLGLEVLVYFKWRNIVGWARRTFRLNREKTWFLLGILPLFKLIVLLDIALHTIMLAGRISL